MSSPSSDLQPIPSPPQDKDKQLADLASEMVELNGIEMSKEMLALMERGLHSAKLPKALRNQKAAEAFQDAFELIGGTARLALWADKNPDKFYSIFGRQIAATMAPVVAGLPQTNQAKQEQWPEWLTNRRLAYQEADRVIEDVKLKPISDVPRGSTD